MRRAIYVSHLFVSLMIACVLVVGCDNLTAQSSPSASIPSASNYPADISGHVIIAETVNAKYQSGTHVGETMEMTPLEGQIYWLVDISVNNKSYSNPITESGWKIVVDDETYDAQKSFMSIQSTYPMTVPTGATGETTIRFPVPNTLKVSDAKLSYQGQEPYSYGTLSGGDKVAVYDWDSKKILLNETTSPTMSVPSNEYSETIQNGVYQSRFYNISVSENYINVGIGIGNFSYKYKLLGNRKAEITYLGSGDSHVFGHSLVTTIELYQIEGTGNLVIEGVECVKIK